MKFIIHNPNQLWYKLTLGNLISGKSYWKGKYEFFFDYLYQNNEFVYVYLDNGNSKKYLERFKLYFKFLLWIKINKLKRKKFKIFYDIKNLEDDFFLFTFFHLNFSSDEEINKKRFINFSNALRHSKVKKIVNLSHYGYNSSIGSINLKNAEIALLISENNLFRNSLFFNHYFGWYKKDVYQIPYVPQKRFIRKKAFKNRKNIAMAIGSITLPIKDSSFKSFFKHEILQPMRLKLFNEKDNHPDLYDCYISKVVSKNKNSNPLLTKLKGLLIIYNYIYNKKTESNLSIDRKYHSYDMVDKFNDYKMFVCPEEIIDLPAIGFVEGMACGTAYFGKLDPMYSDLGMIDKKHYVGYDGTFEDLLYKIKYYQNNLDELHEIALNGQKFVNQNFNANSVSSKFMTDLNKMTLINKNYV